jgi:cytochrome c5
MRAERIAGFRSVTGARVMALVLLASALAADCRTADVRARTDADPALSAVVKSAEAAEIASLPESPAKTLVAERCLMCHGAALISQQRKDAAAWGRTITQMRTWGSAIGDEDQTAIVAYLTEHFGPARKPQ